MVATEGPFPVIPYTFFVKGGEEAALMSICLSPGRGPFILDFISLSLNFSIFVK